MMPFEIFCMWVKARYKVHTAHLGTLCEGARQRDSHQIGLSSRVCEAQQLNVGKALLNGLRA